jgi:tRNA(Ile)-lysidine synthetase-like protein
MDTFLAEWLSHPEYWFSGNDDVITEKYKGLLETEVWNTENKSIMHHLSFIILYDQIPRHIYRNNDPDNIIAIYLKKALFIYNFVNKSAIFDTGEFKPIEWCFFNLPVRHNNVPNEIIKVINDTWNRVKNTNDTDQYIRFLKSSYNRILINQKDYLEYSSGEFTVTSFVDYIDVLANCPFNLKTTEIEETHLYKTIEYFVSKHNLQDIVISLSGGVDSMVCSFILKKLQEHYNFNLVAVHIDYANRSYKEYEFVKDWCAYIKLPVYTRHITEINRTDCMNYGMRSIYEEYTKKVRFETYKAVSASPNVILGHNYDDCFENILTNICNKEKYDNLRGIREEQNIEGICFLRPILNIKKKDIYMFAYNNNIPYLHDSTPEWSQRGKIRDSVKPVLNRWNKDAIPGFFELSDTLAEYEEIVKNIVNTMVFVVKDELKIPCSSFILSKILWKHIFENQSIYNISQKSFFNFLEKLEHTYYNLKYQKNTKLKVVLNKNTTIEFRIGDGFLSFRMC